MKSSIRRHSHRAFTLVESIAAVVLYAACVWLLQRGVGTRE